MTSSTAVEGAAVELTETAPDRADRSVVSQPANNADWEQPLNKATYLKLISAGISFFVAGVNDGSLGALVPYLIRSYDINTAIISAVYGATFLGWLLAAVMNTHLCQYLDLGAMLSLGAILQVMAHALRCWQPPFGLFAVAFFIASVGQAFQDTHANSFAATVKRAHRCLGFIHSMYMAGCLVAPFAATAIASADFPSRWNLFYLFPLGLGVINSALVLVAFRDSVGLRGRCRGGAAVDQPESSNNGAVSVIKNTLRRPGVWLLSLFFFFYLGSVITTGGWVVEYLVRARDGNVSEMGYVPSGFFGGCLLGRLLLAEPTHRWSERRTVFAYCMLCLALQLIFWLVPNVIAASVAISFFGFFSGPLFAAGISVGSRLFPTHLRSTALAFVFLFGQLGGSIFPAATGILAGHAGVEVLQPVVVGLLAATAVSWLLVPKESSLRED